MIVATQLRVGMTIVFKGEPCRVVSIMHVTPGKGRGMMQTKLKNLNSGVGFEQRFNSDEKVEKARLEQSEMAYLYSDSAGYHFMDSKTYEQLSLSAEELGDNVNFLVAEVKFMVEFFDGKPVGIEPPHIVEMKIVETPPSMKGATAASSGKPATLETGLVVSVPDFIETGETIRVDTTEIKYLERAKN